MIPALPTKNTVTAIVVVILLLGLAFFIYDYNKQSKLASEAQANALLWKASLEEAAQVNKENEQAIKDLKASASKFEGLKRHTTIHAAGIIMSEVDIDDIVPLDKSHEGFYTTAYSMNYLEELGLLKMDFLAIKNLTIIHNIIKDIGGSLTFDNIPENDESALKVFTDVDTLGIFQF